MSQSGILTISSSGGGTPITTINGDTGSATGATILLYANNASNGAGSSVKFTNSGSVSLFNVTDSAGNTIIGNNAGNLTNLGGSNTILGAFAGSSLAGNGLSSIATSNVILGYNAANKLTTGFQNNIQGTNAMLNATSANTTVAIGFGTLTQILTGVSNVVIGTNCGTNYTSSESSNILLGTSVLGITGESNSIRIGNNGNGTSQQNKCFIAGIKSVTVTNQQTVTIDSSTGQLGAQTGSPHVVLKSVNVNLKVLGATKLFTTTGNFVVTQINAYGVTVVGATAAQVNIGWTGAAYSDFILGYQTFASNQGLYNGESLGVTTIVNVPYLPASTDIYANVTSNDVGATSNTQRLDFIGYYL